MIDGSQLWQIALGWVDGIAPRWRRLAADTRDDRSPGAGVSPKAEPAVKTGGQDGGRLAGNGPHQILLQHGLVYVCDRLARKAIRIAWMMQLAARTWPSHNFVTRLT
jgi:hypothetical protein